MTDIFERDLRSRAMRLCTVERSDWTLEERDARAPGEHMDRIYRELRREVASGASFDEAHAMVRKAIHERMKKKDQI